MFFLIIVVEWKTENEKCGYYKIQYVLITVVAINCFAIKH